MKSAWFGRLAISILILSPLTVQGGPILDQVRLPTSASPVGYRYSSWGPAQFSYFSDEQRLVHSQFGVGLYELDDNSELVVYQDSDSFAGTFAFSAILDNQGTTVLSGGASLVADAGDGPELLATGSIVDVGINTGNAVYCSESARDNSSRCNIGRPAVAISLNYVRPSLASILGNYWIWTGSYQVESSEPYFDSDFTCAGPREERIGQCYQDSGNFIHMYQVPEPGTLVLVVLGFMILPVFRQASKYDLAPSFRTPSQECEDRE